MLSLSKRGTRLLFRPASVWYTTSLNGVKSRWPHHEKGLSYRICRAEQIESQTLKCFVWSTLFHTKYQTFDQIRSVGHEQIFEKPCSMFSKHILVVTTKQAVSRKMNEIYFRSTFLEYDFTWKINIISICERFQFMGASSVVTSVRFCSQTCNPQQQD